MDWSVGETIYGTNDTDIWETLKQKCRHFDEIFSHWLRLKLPKWQVSMQPVCEIIAKWHFPGVLVKGVWRVLGRKTWPKLHYNDVTMSKVASQITSFTIVYSTVYSGPDQTKHQSSASLAFVQGIHRGPVNSPHKWPVTRKMFPFDDVIIIIYDDCLLLISRSSI